MVLQVFALKPKGMLASMAHHCCSHYSLYGRRKPQYIADQKFRFLLYIAQVYLFGYQF